MIADITPFLTMQFSYDPSKGADCVKLANTACIAMTDKPLFKGVRYKTLKQALRIMKDRGYTDLRDALEKHPELKRVHVSHTQCGDFGVIKIDNVWTLLINDGSQFLGMGEVGLMQIPARLVRSVYRI